MELIAIRELSSSHNIDIAFFESLSECGLIAIEESGYVSPEQLENIEKYIHFYYDLNINLEGIEAINHLLDKINQLQNEIQLLKNRLRLYEGEP